MDSKKLQIHLSPLQGHTDSFYRNAVDAIFGGIDTYYTPFVRLEKGHTFRSRELRDIRPENNTVRHLVPQLIASEPDELRELADLFVKNGYTEADLNMGCPFPMLARRHKGSGLLAHPDEVEALLRTMEEMPELKFSVKMRLGWDNPSESMALVEMLNASSVSHVALHARLGQQQYKGEVDLDAFAAFAASIRKPLYYNGDLRTPAEIDAITTRFPQLAGVLIGRGILANPALAFEYKQGTTLDVRTKKAKMMELHNTIFTQYADYLQGDKQLLEKMKPFWEYLTDELEKRTRKKIEKANKVPAYEAAVALAFSQWGKVEKPVIEEDDDVFIG